MSLTVGASRRLIWTPIIHTQTDLGSLGEEVRRSHLRRSGRLRWEKHVQAIGEFWELLREHFLKGGLDHSRTRLYQDGLPVCDREVEIVRDLATAGNKNHQLLLDLMNRGCRLTGTEAPELLLEEYNLTRALLATPDAESAARASRGPALLQDLLQRRDRFIAQRIGATLEDGGTGILFLGLLHDVRPYLPADIAVERLGVVDRLIRATGVPPRRWASRSRHSEEG